MTPAFEHIDERYGDIYLVYVIGGAFAFCLRHVGQIGNDPIFYDALEELPEGARHDITQKIDEI